MKKNQPYFKEEKKEKKLYTQSELDVEIGKYANTKLYQEGYKSGVKAENEACALECDYRSGSTVRKFKQKITEYWRGRFDAALKCGEVIRARIK